MSPLTEPTRIILRNGWQPMDPDAAAYITAVETADGQALEEPVKIAIDNFVLGCKADGIWDAIKASCILAGARTLNGALVPLAGTAPTNLNFVSGDYDRKTGLVGDGSTKYLNSNRNNNADPQNNNHNSVFLSTLPTTNVSLMGAGAVVTGANNIISGATRNRSDNAYSYISPLVSGLIGMTRSTSSSYRHRASKNTESIDQASATPYPFNLFIFARNFNNSAALISNARLAFYSIGEALDLALLDARVTDLINKFAEVIP